MLQRKPCQKMSWNIWTSNCPRCISKRLIFKTLLSVIRTLLRALAMFIYSKNTKEWRYLMGWWALSSHLTDEWLPVEIVLCRAYKKILQHIQLQYPEIHKIADPENSTSYNYSIPGHQGNIGIIAAFSRTFCGTCNRIRVTAQGTLKTCLYDNGVLNIKELIRSGKNDEELKKTLLLAFNSRSKDGFEAEGKRTNHQPVSESMSTIGG